MEFAAVKKFVLRPITRPFGHLLNQKRNIDELEREVERLYIEGDLLLHSIESVGQNREIHEEDAVRRLQAVHKHFVKSKDFLDEVHDARMRRSSLNFRTWYKLSKKARKLRQNIIGIQGGKFDSISYFTPFPKLNSDAVSSASVFGKIMEMLKNPYIGMIGVYGQGVSNTTLTKEVAEKAVEDMLFDVVIKVGVTQNQQIEKIRRETVDTMGLKFEDCSEEETVDKDSLKTILIILDDLWQELDLYELGIPFGDTDRGCKILLTSRNEEVLSRIDNEATFQLGRGKHVLSHAVFSSKIKNRPVEVMPSSEETRMDTPVELKNCEDLLVKPSNIVKAKIAYVTSTPESSSDIVLQKPVKSWSPLPSNQENFDEVVTPIYNKMNTQESIPSIHKKGVLSKLVPYSQAGNLLQEAKQICVESSALELEDLSKPSNTEDEEKAAYTPPESWDTMVPVKKRELRMMTKKEHKAEGSHPMTLDLHQGQPSSSIDSDQKDNVTIEEHEDRLLIAHGFLFPVDYEFTKEELIRLWIAEGLFWKNQSLGERVEDDASVKFDSFVHRELIVPSRIDPSKDFQNLKVKRLLYKLHESVESLFGPTIFGGGYVRVSDGNLDAVPEKVTHLCILYKSFDDAKFYAIERFKNLRTLFLLPDYGIPFEKVPRDIFFSLKNITTLNFSRSFLLTLPSSIGNLISLQYIDLSYTPIKALPDSIDELHNLQTLKLRGCRNLVRLPNGMRKLTNLRHLDFDGMRQLESMPPGIGNLTNLQTLSAFLVGKEEGCKIRELKNARNLTGGFCISRLENVLDLEDVREASLIDKSYITALELRWNGGNVEHSIDDEKILEQLQPSLGLQELGIMYYGGSKLPAWISNRSYECLVDLFLYCFKNCCHLPSLGDLPSLQFLHIARMNELERIDQLFCRSGGENSQDIAFLRLEKLRFDGLPKLEEWIGVRSGDFPSLRHLELNDCPKLKLLPSLSCLRKSLKLLELFYCQNIMPFLHGEEKVSLEKLFIKDCPELKKCFDKMQGQDWPKIAHVPIIWIDGQNISAK